MANKKISKATLKFGNETLSLSKSKTQAAVRYSPGAKANTKKSGKKTSNTEQIRDFEVLNMNRGIDAKLDQLRSQPEVSVGTHVWN
ncbi:MAG: hypothetical protein IT269_08915, partial [Saprospiraceae bacterium]|nr:hypothetical protein [Saprospiraceae bacterium]